MKQIKKESLFIFCSIAVITASTFLAAEIFLRMFYPTPYYGYSCLPPQQQLFQYDSLLGWKGRPNVNAIFACSDYNTTVTHDRFGYRNLTPPYVESKINILVLGDSYGWGWGAEDNEVFSARLNSNYDYFNVYNLSSPGYGTDQEYLTLKKFLESNVHSGYKGAILLFYINDFNDVSHAGTTYPKPRFVNHNNNLILENVPVPETKREVYDRKSRDHTQYDKGILRHFYVYNLIKEKGPILVRNIQNKLSPKDGLKISSNKTRKPYSFPEDTTQMTFRLLKEIDMLCKQNNMFFHIVMLMTGNTLDAEQKKMKQFAADLSTEHIEVSYFHSRMFPSTDLWMDGHLSKYGHKVLASDIAKILQEKKAQLIKH